MIAVTGANGLLGSFIVRELVAARKPFVALKRAGSDTSLLGDLDGQISWRNADVLDTVMLNEALGDVTAVIHAAALVSFNPRDKRRLYDINVLGTRHIVNACLANNIRRFVHISSVGALGKQKGQETVNEGQKWVNNPLNTAYGESKYLAELEVMRGQEEGLSTVIINPSVILAPADWNRSSAMIFRYVYRQKPFYADGTINFVDVRDVAAITLRLLESPYQGERFIANAGTMHYKALFDRIAENFGKKPPAVKLGKKTIGLLAWLENIRSILLGSTPLITRETARNVGTDIFYSHEKVKKTLNFNFQSVDETLRWCCRYYLRQVNGEK